MRINLPAFLFVVFLALAPATTKADPLHCLPPSGNHNTNNRVDVYINADSLDALYDYYGNQGTWNNDTKIGIVIQALEQWNSSANGREFVYKGFTSDEDGECNRGTIVGLDAAGIVNATAVCNGSGFLITLRSRQVNGVIRRFVTGDPANVTTWNATSAPSFHDAIGYLTHELGHAVGIGDLGFGAPASGVMNNNTVRELCQIDQECAELYYDGASSRSQDVDVYNLSSGAISFNKTYTGKVRTAPGVSAGGGTGAPDKFRGMFSSSNYTYAQKYSSGDLLVLGQSPAIDQVRAHRRELSASNRDQIIGPARATINYGDANAEAFPVKVLGSSSGFESGVSTISNLRECITPTTGFLSGCGIAQDIYTARRVAQAYDDFRGRSVTAWTAQDRTNANLNGRLMVSVGVYDNDPHIVAPPTYLGVKSDTAPALACKGFKAGIYDCIIAYTNINDPKNTIRMKRFHSGSGGSTHYNSLAVESTEQLIASNGWHRTATNMALAYHDGYWWIGFKLGLATGNGGLRVYKSVSGATDSWAYVGTYAYAASGAQAVSEWTGNNRIRITN